MIIPISLSSMASMWEKSPRKKSSEVSDKLHSFPISSQNLALIIDDLINSSGLSDDSPAMAMSDINCLVSFSPKNTKACLILVISCSLLK